ncbi:MAG: dNTP triphosphohydrolase [Candidatus Melainabacteria bacterium]|nr:dNTP triphosphohydrolase [Candidatus Melainabacteria bacterium]
MNSPVINETWQLTRNTLELIRDSRTPTQVDRDRLVYATSVARLAEVTQVISADHGYVFHNRLTHSLKVAQLSRRIAEHLLREQGGQVAEAGGLDPDAAEAAGLAHDLGHPPFGHIAEDELNLAIKKLDSEDGYEGNAQSFRLVAKLMVGDAIDRHSIPLPPGLNLTRSTLNGILKYPWMINENPSKQNKWGSYKTERDLFNWVRQDYDTSFGVRTKSLEAEVMDWADDITYAVHDVVDFYCAGRIPLEQLGRKNSVELKSFLDEVFERPGNESLKTNRQQLEERIQYIVDFVFSSIDSRYTGTIDQRKTLWQLMTLLIGN